MHVLILGVHPTRGHGMRRLSQLVERAWRDAGAEVTVVTAPASLSRRVPWESAGRGVAAVESAAWLGRNLRRRGASVDLVHVIDPRDCLWTASLPGDVPVTVSCHDISGLLAALGETPGRRGGAVDRLRAQLVLKGLQRVDHVLCTSRATAAAVQRLTGHDPVVLHPPVDPELAPRSRRTGSRLAPAWPYVLTVAGTGWQSRREVALHAWAHLRRTRSLDGTSLVVIGPALSKDEEGLVAGCGGHVEVLPDVPSDQLGVLYSGAEAVLALGRVGTFAWPIAEAHQCGRPVLATDGDSFQEVGGDGCVYVPVEGMANFDALTWSAIAEDLTAPLLASRALTNAARFQWQTFVARLPAAAVPAVDTPPRRPVPGSSHQVPKPKVPKPKVPKPKIAKPTGPMPPAISARVPAQLAGERLQSDARATSDTWPSVVVLTDDATAARPSTASRSGRLRNREGRRERVRG